MVSPTTSKVVPKRYESYAAHWQQRKADERSRLRQRHQSGLRTAKALADILKTDFGATKVVLFGSMLSVNDTHMSSDIDLAVWGLPSDVYTAALAKLMSGSEDFGVDLVRIEEAVPSLKAYIEKKGLALGSSVPQGDDFYNECIGMPSYAVLVGRIRREFGYIAAQYPETKAQLEVAKETGQNAYWMAVSLGLHGIYTGIEKVFEQIAREVDGSLQKGDRWHKALLEQMASDIAGIRSAVIDAQTLEALERYLGFRHVVRSNYAYRLDPERIETTFRIFENCYEPLCQQIDDFCDFLIAID